MENKQQKKVKTGEPPFFGEVTFSKGFFWFLVLGVSFWGNFFFGFFFF